MSSVHQLHDQIAVVGWACRLPGAPSITDLWSLLLEGRCTVGQVPDDRFSRAAFLHPRKQERGKAYIFAAGVLDDIWGFDPSVFGLSPREAEQMDPQQRLLLQLAWEALEDAGIPPSSIAGEEVGVFVGGSLTDYAHAFYGDPAVGDTHFATGNALSVLANRISYVFNLHGPSVTVDTACSSSLVALHQAAEALRSGRIDTAIVGGVNIIASPMSFITFSQASMLSPTGLCQAFDEKADGFVRAEGGVVLVLRKAALAQKAQNPVHGVILASDVNSDGRTNGISLPSPEAQESLLDRVYSRAGIEPSRLAFMEAHGTGTPVGDPIEAAAIGRSLGRERLDPLPIGSIKTNIGHLEPASGLAGVVKALLALNHGVLPPSLHYRNPNPNIDFAGLNLTVCDQPMLLPHVRQQCAGINNFGFGGTNAHVVVGPGRKPLPASDGEPPSSRLFALSADTRPALAALAERYAGRIAQLSDEETARVASAAAYRRERMSHQLVVSSVRRETVVKALEAFAEGRDDPFLTVGAAAGTELPVAFVYSGNGGQRVGMGVSAYRRSDGFRARFDQIDGYFAELAGWSLAEAMLSDRLGERLDQTSVAQPLIFAIQSASTAALRERGLNPAAVLGHSVGEVAAAEAAGVIDLRTAVKVIHHRSRRQELVRGRGGMAAVSASAEVAVELALEAPGVEVAAVNSPRSVTVAGPVEALAAFKLAANRRGVAFLDLKLDYPFHTSLMTPIRQSLVGDLSDILTHDAPTPFVSTVTGACVPGRKLDGDYWWRNVREPVQFVAAIREAASLGARCFLEIGPTSLLLKHIGDSLAGEGKDIAKLAALVGDDGEDDPFDRAAARALVLGAQVEPAALFGADPGGALPLPSYPWRQKPYRFTPTAEAAGVMEADRHPFAGVRSAPDSLEWRGHVDTRLVPALADHRVGSQVLFPGAGFIEIAFAVGRQWLKTDQVSLVNFEILRPLDLSEDQTAEILARVSPGSSGLEIFSRPRLSKSAFVLHSRGKLWPARPGAGAAAPTDAPAHDGLAGEELYRLADACGLHYGPAFRLTRRLLDHADGRMSVELQPAAGASPYLLDPARLDACFQAVIRLFPEFQAAERGVAYVPVRVDEASILRPGVAAARAIVEVVTKSERSILSHFTVLGEDGLPVASLRGALCQAMPVRRVESFEGVAISQTLAPADGSVLGVTGVAASPSAVAAAARAASALAGPGFGEGARLLEGWAAAAAYEIARGLAGAGDLVRPDVLVDEGRLPVALKPWLVCLLRHLEAADLARPEGDGWATPEDPSMPPSSRVAAALVGEFSDLAAELLLAAEISAFAARVGELRAVAPERHGVVTPSALDFLDIAASASTEADEALRRLLAPALAAEGRTLRVLQLGVGPFAREAIADGAALAVTLIEPDQRRLDRAQSSLPKRGDLAVAEPRAAIRPGAYDLIVARDGLHRLPDGISLGDLRGALAPGGLLAALEPPPSLYRDLVRGLDPDWFRNSLPDFPVGALRSADDWRCALLAAGFDEAAATAVAGGHEAQTLALGSAAAADPQPLEAPSVAFAPSPEGRGRELSLSLQKRLAAVGGPATASLHLVHGLAVDAVDDLSARCLEIKAWAEAAPEGGALWLVFSGAQGGTDADPVAAGAWAFSRALANEAAHLDLRRIDVAGDLPAGLAAERILEILARPGGETEFRIDREGVRVLRADTVRRALDGRGARRAEAARLQRTQSATARLQWRPIERRAPAEGEVEIAVEATGVNFRDLMWSLGLLPDDILEGGFAGPTLGLECAGRVIRVGPGVAGIGPGDAVAALAGDAYATHVTVPAVQALKLPEGVDPVAGAAVPVTFLTAYYALVTQARLQPGEWVLIHGGAGGVGLAAVQIAQTIGARVIATVGAPAKAALLRTLGVEHVLDSRSTAFVDGVRAITGAGVDVVLNSLALEAMEQSLGCLAPFGRFVELGKRDYISNTHIGLRPFRKNLTYYAVDVDQLMARGGLARHVLDEVMARFRYGDFSPLLHTAFDAAAAPEAFALMQQSAHVGKIVVRPPKPGAVRAAVAPFRVDPDGTHLVTGAFGGFGLETARWLVERGARSLILLGRRGPADAAARAAVAEFEARGVKVLCDPCDVTDPAALGRILAKARRTLPPLKGVIHSAMVLEDCIVANLDEERLRRVLAPKVAGADNLDLQTRDEALDYFVLYSSVTTLIGNPGQGAYVAANAYMEGLARRRRSQGLPAMALGWGPIVDVGVVARTAKLQAGLEKLTGARGLTAREALDLMAQALEAPADSIELAAVTIAPNDGSFGGDRLAILRSPTYAGLIKGRSGAAEAAASAVDIRALAAAAEPEAVVEAVADAIVVRLAKVLHASEEDINRTRPLGEIGLDSLMGLELGLGLEEAFGMRIALGGGAGAMTVVALAEEIIAQAVRAPAPAVEAAPAPEPAARSRRTGSRAR